MGVNKCPLMSMNVHSRETARMGKNYKSCYFNNLELCVRCMARARNTLRQTRARQAIQGALKDVGGGHFVDQLGPAAAA